MTDNKRLIKNVEKWVKGTYSNANHLLRTGYWIKKLDPKATDSMYIAAITHDMERAFQEGRNPPSKELAGAKWDDSKYNLWHGARSAKFVSEFLREKGADVGLVKEVADLIEHHEDGGFKNANVLKDADSISFLEINTPMFIGSIGNPSGVHGGMTKGEVRKKFDYMYERISSAKAKNMATPFYKKAIGILKNIK